MTSNSLIYDGFNVGRSNDDAAIVIDGMNIIYMTRKLLQSNIDYKKLSAILYTNIPGIRTMTFVIPEYMTLDEEKIPSDITREFKKGYSQIRSLLLWLANNRYTVISREIYQQDTDEDSVRSTKNPGHMDVEITAALYRAARYAKHVIFIGSSSKYASVLKDLKGQGLTITVIGVKKPTQSRSIGLFYTADELRSIDNFVDLSDPFFALNLLDPRTTINSSRRSEGFSVDEVSKDIKISNFKDA